MRFKVNSNRFDHALTCFDKSRVEGKAKLDFSCLSKEQSNKLHYLNDICSQVMRGKFIQKEELDSILKSFDEINTSIEDELERGKNDIQAKKIAAKRYRIMCAMFVSLMMVLRDVGQYPASFSAATYCYPVFNKLAKQIRSFPKEDQIIFEDLFVFLMNKLADVDIELGNYYLDSGNYHAASSYYLKGFELTDYISNLDWRNVVKGSIYVRLSNLSVKNDELNKANFFLQRLRDLLGKKIQDPFLSPMYIPILKEYLTKRINTLDAQDSSLLSDDLKLLPDKTYNKNFYLEICSEIVKLLLNKQYFDLAEPLIQTLKECNLLKFKKYGEGCSNFINKKKWKDIKSYLQKINPSDKYSIVLDDKTKIIQIKLLTMPSTCKQKTFFSDDKRYKIERLGSDKIIKLSIDVKIDELQSLLLNIESYTFLSSVQVPPNEESKKTASVPVDSSKEEIDFSPPEQSTSSLKKAKEKTKGREHSIKNQKQETSNKKVVSSRVSCAEKLGFKTAFKNEKIYPISTPFIPDGTYFGFYSRTNSQEVANEIHKECEIILERGRIKTKKPCIKYVPNLNDTFKICPEYDFRMFSRVVDENKNNKSKLLAFDQPETHRTQKKIYKLKSS